VDPPYNSVAGYPDQTSLGQCVTLETGSELVSGAVSCRHVLESTQEKSLCSVAFVQESQLRKPYWGPVRDIVTSRDIHLTKGTPCVKTSYVYTKVELRPLSKRWYLSGEMTGGVGQA
jgi:hypothetical protein